MTRSTWALGLFCILASWSIGCSKDAAKDTSDFVIAVMMPLPTMPNGVKTTTLADIDWAVENVNLAGGIDDRRLVVEYFDYGADDNLESIATAVAHDKRFDAAIGPGSSDDMFLIAPLFQEARKPLVSYTATSGEFLRAYGGASNLWRTKESDIVQTELMVRAARESDAESITLYTPLDGAGFTFFNWFGFFATEYGFSPSQIHVEPWQADTSCVEPIQTLLAAGPSILYAVPSSPEDTACAIGAYASNKSSAPGTKLVFADTGLDVNFLRSLGDDAVDVEGFSAAPAAGNGFEAAFKEAKHWMGGIPNNAANGYDAVLLIAYGLQRATHAGGSLDNAMRQVVGFQGDAVGWNAAGIEAGLAAIRRGEEPNIEGATGGLDYDPSLFVDPVGTTFAKWRWRPEGPQYYTTYNTRELGLLTSTSALAGASGDPEVEDGGYEPTSVRRRLAVVLGAFSSGWANYRHQSDLLRQYKYLKSNGVTDDDIVLIGANDIAESSSNRARGVVRNEVGGDNLNNDVVYDYGVTLSAERLLDVVSGVATSATPEVASLDEETDLYVYLSGHGGSQGLSLDATSAEEGLDESDNDEPLTPEGLRTTLCEMQKNHRYRRVLIVIESCYSGTFGDASWGGLAMGCTDDEGNDIPLQGVLLITAANAAEVSYATEYDASIKAWLADGFSLQYARAVEANIDTSIYDLYTDVYRRVSGSHVSLYNASAFGSLRSVEAREFLAP